MSLLQRRLDCATSSATCLQGTRPGDNRLFSFIGNRTANPATEARNAADTSVALARALLRLCHPLTDTVPFRLSERRQDGEHQLAYPVASHIPAQVNHVENEAAGLEFRKPIQRIRSRPAIQLSA
jgi:hypothetical protein